MLYDKRWDKSEIKADPFSLESLIAWLEKQPADRAYHYIDARKCMLCQYFRAQGIDVDTLSIIGIITKKGRHIQYPNNFAEIANGDFNWQNTFGAALERARAALKSQ